MDEAVGACVDGDSADGVASDGFERWKMHEPKWIAEQYLDEGSPVRNWTPIHHASCSIS
jgi:hypothetical protein